MSSQTKKSDAEKNAFRFMHYASKFPIFHLVLLCLTSSIPWHYEVPLEDIAFSILFTVYLFVANAFRFRFNSQGRGDKTPDDLILLKEDPKDWLVVYINIFALVGLALPAGTLFFGPLDVAQAMAPHLFLTMAQVTVECIMCNSPMYHDLIRILAPIGFSAYREKALVEWVGAAWNSNKGHDLWCRFGVGLAALNLVMWSYNLFVFLLLRMTPNYLDPVESPSAPVVWKGHLIPVLISSTKTKKKRP